MHIEQSRRGRSDHRASVAEPSEVLAFLNFIRAEPDISISVDRPDSVGGEWWFDLSYAGRRKSPLKLAILWKSDLGFGLFTHSEGYGDRPAEIYRHPEIVAKRIQQLLEQWREQRKIRTLWLSDMRELIGTQQVDVATQLKCKQPAVSRMESRGDVKLSTLFSYVEAMGGRLELRVHFEELEATIGAPL